MTDNEITKALECCCEAELNEDCEKMKCPFFDNEMCNCMNMGDKNALYRYALDLINRQQSAIDVYMQENDRLKTAYIQVSEDRNEIRKETEAEIEAWKKINQRLYDEMEERRKEDIGVAKGYARIEAVKEFWSRLQGIAYQSGDWSHGEHPMVVELDDAEEIYEEMVGE